MKKYVLFIGIDISKNWIDVALTWDGQKKQMVHQRFSNQIKGFKKMLERIKKLALKKDQGFQLCRSVLFCMEHTGIYTIPLCEFLQNEGLGFVVDSALRIKRSLGIKRGKDDKADSKDIARYVYLHRNHLKISKLPAKALMDMKHLLAYRDRLVKQLNATRVAAKETKAFSSKDSVAVWVMEDSEEIVGILKTKIKAVERQLDELVQGDTEIKELFRLATSVKGIGKINALQMIVHTNCFKSFDSARQFACYIGIAPFHRKSGETLNAPAKVSPLGHKKLKALLTNGVLAAIQYDKELNAYYERKLAQGKSEFSVLNAVKNKLISRVFATVKRGTPYVELFNYA